MQFGCVAVQNGTFPTYVTTQKTFKTFKSYPQITTSAVCMHGKHIWNKNMYSL